MTDREIVQQRTFDAPPEAVYEAWTRPAHVTRWWGPNGFTTTTEHMDVRPGGEWRYVMHGPDGADFPNLIEYHDVVPAQRLVYTHGDGTPDDSNAFEVEITFDRAGGRTDLTMRAVFKTAEARDYVIREFHADEGGRQTLARLAG